MSPRTLAAPLLAALVASCVAPSRAPAPPRAEADAMPRPPREGEVLRPDALRKNTACEGCHADIAAEWRASSHRAAFTNAPYQRALAREPLAFCRGCHAPEADPAHAPPPEAAAIGVGCVSCHATREGVLAGPARGSDRPAPHAVVRDARFATADACARCHEFAFPDTAVRGEPLLMQSTVSEHLRSPRADTPCAGCHMPTRAGHASHLFPGGHDDAFVRTAARATATRIAPDRVRIVVAPVDAGHAFPTGDLFRRLEVSVEALGQDYAVITASRGYLTRHFRDVRRPNGPTLRDLAWDDRPESGPRTVELELGPEAPGRPIAWRVAYQRVEHPRSDREDDSLVEGEVVLAEGTLPP